MNGLIMIYVIFAEKFEGDVYLLMKLLLPGFVKRVYNINSKQLVKLFSQIFRASQEEMLEHLNEVRNMRVVGTCLHVRPGVQ